MDLFAEIAIVKKIEDSVSGAIRMYRLSIPFGCPYEELHAVIAELVAIAKQMEANQQATGNAAQSASSATETAVTEK
jgi:hypothetical protein